MCALTTALIGTAAGLGLAGAGLGAAGIAAASKRKGSGTARKTEAKTFSNGGQQGDTKILAASNPVTNGQKAMYANTAYDAQSDLFKPKQ